MAMPFPAELFFEIALHLPATADVLALGLTNRFVNKALSAPALYRQRISLRGWDTGAWDDENQAADTPFPALLKRWMRADYACSRIEQLLDQAVAEDYFRIQSASLDEGEGEGEDEDEDEDWSWLEWRDDIPNDGGPAPALLVSRTRLDGVKSVAWVKLLSEVLPSVAMHHRLNNVPRVIDARYHGVIKAFMLTITQLCFSPELAPRSSSPNSLSASSSSECDWYERACFGMAALFMYDDAGPEFRAIFESIWEYLRYSVVRALYRSYAAGDQYSAIFIHKLSPRLSPQSLDDSYERISRRFSVCLVVQLIMHLELRFEDPNPPYILEAPRIPRSGLVLLPYGEPFLLGPGSIRPWLQDGMAGTPFAGLSTSPKPWAGYCTTGLPPQCIVGDMPMFFDLQIAPPEAGESRYISFQAEDAVGRFTMAGTCDSRTGLVSARTVQDEGITREWDGVVTPFGMAGRWGAWNYGGWWWIWPREWSPTTRTPRS
ncbi:hypothetical protein BC834DRAFT_897433 [Gloeopeniophorella convolvens]|nr:hypothetical protein BC834DRAFT_897433 [Gloeopeniophorella convolvens]